MTGHELIAHLNTLPPGFLDLTVVCPSTEELIHIHRIYIDEDTDGGSILCLSD